MTEIELLATIDPPCEDCQRIFDKMYALLAAGEARAAALQLTNDRLRLSWREDVAEEKLRADKAEAAIVSLQAELQKRDWYVEQLCGDVQAMQRDYANARRAVKTGALCPQCGFETVTSSVTMESFESICGERDEAQEQLSALQAQLQAITQEMREKADDCKQWSGIPCQSENSWHADTYNRWADALDGTGKDTRE